MNKGEEIQALLGKEYSVVDKGEGIEISYKDKGMKLLLTPKVTKNLEMVCSQIRNSFTKG